jgi:metallo-beta-lactamase family protein
MKATFFGAAHEVTGSCTLLECAGSQGLVDCGMEQGKDIFVNQPLSVAPGELDFVLLTHAHVDHSGKLPLLYKEGYTGPIYATQETCDLCRIMLIDCAEIHESEAEYQNRKNKRSGAPLVEPLYTVDDAQEAIAHLRPVNYGETVQIAENISVRFSDVAHLLGSACIEVWLQEGDEQRKIVFSGDLGNYDQPIIRNAPQKVAEADYVVVESTYGDRLHDRSTLPVDKLAEYIQRTLDRGGNVVIPSFAVGRTQEMLYFIREIKEKNMVTGHDGFPVYVDSPMANEATAIYLQCSRDCLDEETRALVEEGINPIWFEGLNVSVSAEDSKAINVDPEPKVILAASGMCEGGRIRHHLKHNLWRPECTVLFVGYQAAGTLGRALYDGEKTVKLFGEWVQVNCEIGFLPGKSGHADRDGLAAWLRGIKEMPKTGFVNHGEDKTTEAFAAYLAEEFGYTAAAPYSGTEFDLLTGEYLARPKGVRIKKESEGRVTANDLYSRLVDAGDALRALIRASRGRPNKLLRGFLKDLEELVKKYK